MLKRKAGKTADVFPQANGKFLEHQQYETARQIYQTLHTSGLGKFTFSMIDSLCNDLNAIVHQLDRLPETTFKELIAVIDGLAEARNELRLALFLFAVEEIVPLHRLVMRNRAILRGRGLLHRLLLAWPLAYSSS